MTDSDRRRAPRFNVTFRLACDDGQGFGNATVINLSESGALVQSSSEYPLGHELNLVPVGPAGDMLFDVPATVVRIIDSPRLVGAKHFGLHFHDVTPQRAVALRRLCAQMPESTGELDEPGLPSGGPPREGGEPHHRIRRRPRSSDSPRWSRRPFA